MVEKIPYIYPIIKPGAIHLSVYAHLFSETEKCLIFAKSNSLEIFNVYKDGLSLVDVIKCEDKIKSLIAFTPKRDLPNYQLSNLQDIFYSLVDGSVHVVRFRDGNYQFFSDDNLTDVDITPDYFNCTNNRSLTRDLNQWVDIDYFNNYIVLIRSDGHCRMFFLSHKNAKGRIGRGSDGDSDGDAYDDDLPIDLNHVRPPVPRRKLHSMEINNSLPFKDASEQLRYYRSFFNTSKAKGLKEVFSEIVSFRIDATNIEFAKITVGSQRKDGGMLTIVQKVNFQQMQSSLYQMRPLASTNKFVFKASKSPENGITNVIERLSIGGFLSFNEEKIYYYNKSGRKSVMSCYYDEGGFVDVVGSRTRSRSGGGGGTSESIPEAAFESFDRGADSSSGSAIDKGKEKESNHTHPHEYITFSSVINNTTIIIGSEIGTLYLINLTIDESTDTLTHIKSSPIAVIPGINNIIHLTSTYFMTTSSLTSSMLIDLNVTNIDHKLFYRYKKGKSVNPSLINPYKIIYQIDNLGPILDFYVRKEKVDSSNQIIACTGNGIVKRLNSGIKPTEISNLYKVDNIQHIWSYENNNNTLLVISCIDETKIFSITSDESNHLSNDEIIEHPLLNLTLPTIYFGEFQSFPIHINENQITIIKDNPIIFNSVDKFFKADISNNHIVISTKNNLLLFNSSLQLIDQITYVNEISSISFVSNYILISFWHSSELKLFKITEKQKLQHLSNCNLNTALINSESISRSSSENPFQVRSVLLKEITEDSGTTRIQSFVGLTNGNIIIFDDYLLKDGKQFTIGQKPVSFYSNSNCLFAISDKMSLAIDTDFLFQSISSINNPRSICKISNDILAIAFDKGYQFIKLADLTSIHIDEVIEPSSSQSLTIPIAIEKLKKSRGLILWDKSEHQYLTTVDINKMNTLNRYKLDSTVQYCCLTVFEKNGTTYCLVGGESTNNSKLFRSMDWEKYDLDESILTNGLESIKEGVISQYELTEEGIIIATSHKKIIVHGGVYTLFTNENKTVVGIQSKIIPIPLPITAINTESKYSNTTTCCTSIKERDGLIVAGDLTRSIVITERNPNPRIIREYSTISVSDLDLIPEENSVLVGDSTGTLFVMKYELPNKEKNKKGYIKKFANINLGEGIITKIQPITKSSIWNPIIGKNSSSVINLSAYASTSKGGIYGIGFIEDERYIAILNSLQRRLFYCLVMGSTLSPYHHLKNNANRRKFYGEDGKEAETMEFLDGELLQSFLYMDLNQQLDILQGKYTFGVSIEATWYEVIYLLERLECIG